MGRGTRWVLRGAIPLLVLTTWLGKKVTVAQEDHPFQGGRSCTLALSALELILGQVSSRPHTLPAFWQECVSTRWTCGQGKRGVSAEAD